MTDEDLIGMRGEALFTVLIMRFCGRHWFLSRFLGDKAEAKDNVVELIGPANNEASFYVQIKSTTLGYHRNGNLKAKVSRNDVRKLKTLNRPVFIAGMDVEGGKGYLVPITQASDKGFSSVPTTHPIDCPTIIRLWHALDDYWKAMNLLPATPLL